MQGFPADFIGEGLDQTRGWFYTLNVLSVALFKKPAFKNVIVNGIILAEDGNKMSKRLKNYPEPEIVFNQYGADALRLYLLNSPAVQAEDLRFTERGVELVMRQVLIPLWNSYHFLATYAEIYAWKPKEKSSLSPKADIDRWILSLLQKLTQQVTSAMNEYTLGKAVLPFVEFIEQLTNWYIRRSRPRFWADEASQDRDEAFGTLYHVLLTVSQIAAPFVPFLSEAIYLRLRHEKAQPSVHLNDFPLYDSKLRDESLEREMASVQTVVSSGHALRKEQKMKVRQPLANAHVICSDEAVLSALKKQDGLIADELNVKKVTFLPDESSFVALAAKPNFRILGKKVGKLMREVQKAIEAFDQKALKTLFRGETLTLEIEGEKIELTPEDISVERKVREGIVALTSEGITVALDLELSPELLMEGLARELISKINAMRRDLGFAVTDRISITIQTTDRVKACFEQFRGIIVNDVLATEVTFAPCEGAVWDLNGEPTTILLSLSAK